VFIYVCACFDYQRTREVKERLSHRCSDLDKMIPELLGVSPVCCRARRVLFQGW
jgi:hypothetical protein